jgi:hypothetical protein
MNPENLPGLVLSCHELWDLIREECDSIVESILSRDYFEQPHITSSNVLSFYPLHNVNLNIVTDFLIILCIKLDNHVSGLTLKFCGQQCMVEQLELDEIQDYSYMYTVQQHSVLSTFIDSFLSHKCSECG